MKTLYSVIAVTFLTACGKPTSSQLKYDSYHSVALVGTISDGILVTAQTDETAIKDRIMEQLKYSVGHLNGYGAVADLKRSAAKSLEITRVDPLYDGLSRVHYMTSVTVSWPRSRPVQDQVVLILPQNMDEETRQPEAFFNRYAIPPCLSSDAHELSLGNVWYYLRPLNPRCPLARQNAPLSVRYMVDLKPSDEMTSGKSPEYSKFWDDGLLSVTAIFSKYSDAGGPGEIGVLQYRQFYRELVRNFGEPISVSPAVPPSGPGLEIPAVDAEFQTFAGPLHIFMRLTANMTDVSSDFEQDIGTKTATSDLVLYNGHAGLGANITGLANMSVAVPGKYQLYVLNGCDTFAYIDDGIRKKHKDANPEASDFKFVDIISNSMPSQFQYNAGTSINMIVAAMRQQDDYRSLLSTFAGDQKAVVIGEEDNP